MRNKVRITILVVLALGLFSPLSSSIYDDAGTKGFQFLKIPIGARPVGMGGAFVAVSDDINSIYWNPAGLTAVDKQCVSLSHDQWLSDISRQSISYAFPAGSGIFGASLLYLHMGEFTGYDIDMAGDPVRISNFTCRDICGIISYARMIGQASAGVNLKVIEERLEQERSAGASLDLAGIYNFGDTRGFIRDLKLGVNIQNMGIMGKFIENQESLPLNIKAGVSGRMAGGKLLAALEAGKPSDDGTKLGAGIEYNFGNGLCARAGYNGPNNFGSGLSLGLGLEYGQWSLDYAYVPYAELGDAHRVSLVSKFGVPEQQRAVDREKEKLQEEKNRLQEEKKNLDEERKQLEQRKQQLEREKKEVETAGGNIIKGQQAAKEEPVPAGKAAAIALEPFPEGVAPDTFTLTSGTAALGEMKYELAAVVNSVEGSLAVKRFRGDTWVKCEPGAYLFEKDIVRTDEGSSAVIIFISGNEVRIRENTKFALLLHDRNVERADWIDLFLGELYSIIKGKNRNYRVNTLTAGAGVRGTEFAVKFSTDEQMDVSVMEGTVNVANAFGRVEVPGEMMTIVLPGKAPLPPFKLVPEKLPLWKEKVIPDEKLKEEIHKMSDEVSGDRTDKLLKDLEKEKGIRLKEEKPQNREKERQLEEKEKKLEKDKGELIREKESALVKKTEKEKELGAAGTTGEREKITKELRETENRLKTAEEQDIILRNDEQQIAREKELLAEELSRRKITIVATGEAINFEYDSDNIPQESHPVLEKIAGLLRELSDYRVNVAGYTDNQGTDDYNMKLSENRAESIKKYFVETGALSSERFVVIGAGASEPVASNDTPEGRAKNRRVEITLEKLPR